MFLTQPSESELDLEWVQEWVLLHASYLQELQAMKGRAAVTPVYSLGDAVSPFLKNLMVG